MVSLDLCVKRLHVHKEKHYSRIFDFVVQHLSCAVQFFKISMAASMTPERVKSVEDSMTVEGT